MALTSMERGNAYADLMLRSKSALFVPDPHQRRETWSEAFGGHTSAVVEFVPGFEFYMIWEGQRVHCVVRGRTDTDVDIWEKSGPAICRLPIDVLIGMVDKGTIFKGKKDERAIKFASQKPKGVFNPQPADKTTTIEDVVQRIIEANGYTEFQTPSRKEITPIKTNEIIQETQCPECKGIIFYTTEPLCPICEFQGLKHL